MFRYKNYIDSIFKETDLNKTIFITGSEFCSHTCQQTYLRWLSKNFFTHKTYLGADFLAEDDPENYLIEGISIPIKHVPIVSFNLDKNKKSNLIRIHKDLLKILDKQQIDPTVYLNILRIAGQEALNNYFTYLLSNGV